jgi:hypothetical protein
VILLDRLPIADRPHLVNVQGKFVDVYRNQIVVWVSIAGAPRPFPALLDTGHSHNFSISSGQLRRWSGAVLEMIGDLEIGKTRVSQFRAEILRHSNVRGHSTLSGRTYRLETPQGISVFDEGSEPAPRLPLLGLRTLIANQLRLAIDGKRREVTLRTAGWW